MYIREHGVQIVRNILSRSSMDIINAEVNDFSKNQSGHGIRNADKKFESISKLSTSEALIELAITILGSRPQIIRVIFFDKTPDKNWLVTWHQDKTISLSSKYEIAGWGPWSIKDSVHHVQPPLEVLNSMLTFRLHLDDSDENNGCLKVFPRSHKLGILSQAQIEELSRIQESYMCRVDAGDMVIMRPHILHSSSKSISPNHRRVVHIEYSNYELPNELSWV